MESNRINVALFVILLVALLPSAVFAAPPSAWAGPYLGVHGGGGVVNNTLITQSGSSSGVFDMTGTMSGAQFGYNIAAGNAVLGLEVKASAADVSGSATCTGVLAGRCGIKLDRLYTIQANVGISVDSLLAYLFAGAATGQFKVSNELPTVTYATSDRHTGLLAGVGGVWAFNNKLNGLVELQYTVFGTNKYVVNNVDASVRTNMTSLIAGINYRF